MAVGNVFTSRCGCVVASHCGKPCHRSAKFLCRSCGERLCPTCKKKHHAHLGTVLIKDA